MRPRQSATLARMIFHTRDTEDELHIGGKIEECRVHHTDTNGLYFTRPMFDSDKTIYGPVQYAWPPLGVTGATAVSTFGTHTHSEPIPVGAPDTGDVVLIIWAVMLQGGYRPWVVGWIAT